MSPPQTKQLSQFDSMLVTFQKMIFQDFGGPRLLKMRTVINAFKGATMFWIIFLMYKYGNYCTGMYLYLFLHGSYGIFWILKDIIFPDGRFNKVISLGSLTTATLFLWLYWLIPVPLAAGLGVSEPSKPRIIFLVSLYVIGLILMLGSDYQKYVALKKKPGLVSTGFFKYTRNPNYLGQIMIYSSFVLCSGHLAGFIILYGVACPVFALNMYLKDVTSYRFKEGWEQYKKQSYILLPKLFPTFPLNAVFYSIILLGIGVFLAQEHPSSTFTNFEFSHIYHKLRVESAL